MAYQFVEAFSSVPPRVRFTLLLAIVMVIINVLYRVVTFNLLAPSWVDIPTAVAVGFYLGRRPKSFRTL